MKKIKTKLTSFLCACFLLAFPLTSLAQWVPSNYDTTLLPSGSIYDIIWNLMMWLLAIFGFVGIIGFVISGILYLTSAGDEEQIKKAKTAMTWSLVGVIVGLVGLVIINAMTVALDPMANGGRF